MIKNIGELSVLIKKGDDHEPVRTKYLIRLNRAHDAEHERHFERSLENSNLTLTQQLIRIYLILKRE